MKVIFKLTRKSGEALLTDELKDILSLVEDGESYRWNLLWIEATGDITGLSVLEFEEIVQKSRDGYLLDWKDLIRLSQTLDQIIEVLLIGDKDEDALVRYNSDTEMRTKCSFCIELVDSSYWEISSDNRAFLIKLKAKYNVEEIDL